MITVNKIQSGILQPVPRQARYLSFSLKPDVVGLHDLLNKLAAEVDGNTVVVGLGLSVIQTLGKQIDGLRVMPVKSENGINIPSTPVDLQCWLRGDDKGELVHKNRYLKRLLQSTFRLDSVIDAFQYGPSLDLTGYEDGTENPDGEEALAAAIVQGKGAGLDGSSFMAIQQWQHHLDVFDAMPAQRQDHTFGRRRSDNEEIDDAPESAHVKRTEQEAFEPPAFILRRSMPWADGQNEGLVFVAFGKSFDPFETLLNNMLGVNDGVTDALFDFTRPLTGCYLWCPPVKDGKLDLSVVL